MIWTLTANDMTDEDLGVSEHFPLPYIVTMSFLLLPSSPFSFPSLPLNTGPDGLRCTTGG